MNSIKNINNDTFGLDEMQDNRKLELIRRVSVLRVLCLGMDVLIAGVVDTFVCLCVVDVGLYGGKEIDA